MNEIIKNIVDEKIIADEMSLDDIDNLDLKTLGTVKGVDSQNITVMSDFSRIIKKRAKMRWISRKSDALRPAIRLAYESVLNDLQAAGLPGGIARGLIISTISNYEKEVEN